MRACRNPKCGLVHDPLLDCRVVAARLVAAGNGQNGVKPPSEPETDLTGSPRSDDRQAAGMVVNTESVVVNAPSVVVNSKHGKYADPKARLEYQRAWMKQARAKAKAGKAGKAG